MNVEQKEFKRRQLLTLLGWAGAAWTGLIPGVCLAQAIQIAPLTASATRASRRPAS